MNNCRKCNKETTNPSFCCPSCSVSYNNSVRPKRKREPNVCCVCNKKFKGYKKSVRFCSRQCDAEHRRQISDNEILLNNGFLSVATNPTIRSFLIRHHGNNCMLCGMDADNWEGKPLTLIVDHIDGKSKNNSLDNLRLVCPNCDSQLPTYKAKNKGNSDRTYFITQK